MCVCVYLAPLLVYSLAFACDSRVCACSLCTSERAQCQLEFRLYQSVSESDCQSINEAIQDNINTMDHTQTNHNHRLGLVLVSLSLAALQLVKAAPHISTNVGGLMPGPDFECEVGKPIDFARVWPNFHYNVDCYECLCPQGKAECGRKPNCTSKSTSSVIEEKQPIANRTRHPQPKQNTTRRKPTTTAAATTTTTTPMPTATAAPAKKTTKTPQSSTAKPAKRKHQPTTTTTTTTTTTRRPPRKYTIPDNYIDWQHTIQLRGTTFELGGGIKTQEEMRAHMKTAAEYFGITFSEFLAKRDHYLKLIQERKNNSTTTTTTTPVPTTTTTQPETTTTTTPTIVPSTTATILESAGGLDPSLWLVIVVLAIAIVVIVTLADTLKLALTTPKKT